MYDRVIKNLRVARPNREGLDEVDVAFKDGKFARMAPEIDASDAPDVVDGKGLIAFPGVVDAHMHIGIYRNLAEDAPTESKCAAMGGVTTSLTYFRTGQYYLNKGGPYLEFFKDMLEQAGGRYHVDYGFHLMPAGNEHIAEMPDIYDKLGVPTFKLFMFYGGYGLHGKSDNQAEFLMTEPGERYDLAHFEFVLRGAKKVVDMYPEARDLISVSFHCENPELMNAWTRIIQEERGLNDMEAYHLARPPALRRAVHRHRHLSRPRRGLPEHQYSPPHLAGVRGDGAQDAGGLPGCEHRSGGHGRAPAARSRQLRHPGQGQPADPHP